MFIKRDKVWKIKVVNVLSFNYKHRNTIIGDISNIFPFLFLLYSCYFNVWRVWLFVYKSTWWLFSYTYSFQWTIVIIIPCPSWAEKEPSIYLTYTLFLDHLIVERKTIKRKIDYICHISHICSFFVVLYDFFFDDTYCNSFIRIIQWFMKCLLSHCSDILALFFIVCLTFAIISHSLLICYFIFVNNGLVFRWKYECNLF